MKRGSLALVSIAFLVFACLSAGCRSGGMPASSTATTAETASTEAVTTTSAAGSASATTSTSTSASASAKVEAVTPAATGYDLYSWEAGGAWNFSLLPGANRLRSFDEIKNAEITAQGIAEIKSKLRKLPSGEKVTWTAKVVNTSMPSYEVVDDLSRYCAQMGLSLTVGY